MKWVSFHILKSFSSARFWIQRRFSKPGTFVLVMLLAFAAMGVDTNLTMAYQGFTLIASILIYSILSCILTALIQSWRRKNSPEFQLIRNLPSYGTVGEKLEYHSEIRNLASHPARNLTWIENLPDPRPRSEDFLTTTPPNENRQSILDRLFGLYRWNFHIQKKRFTEPPEQTVNEIRPGKCAQIPMKLVPQKRGFLRFESVTLAKSDLFGLVRNLENFPMAQSVPILPRRYILPDQTLPGKQQYQQGGVALASSVGESEEFVSLRDYRNGDPIRKIHWRSWAKIGKPVVKEYQDEYFTRHALILDTFLKSGDENIFEEAVSVAASFACTVQTQDSLLDLMFVGHEAHCFTAGRGVSHTEKILEILAGVIPSPHGNFETLHLLVSQHAPEISSCTCIFLHWDESRQKLIQLLESHDVPLQAFLIAPPSDSREIRSLDIPENIHILRCDSIQKDLLQSGAHSST